MGYSISWEAGLRHDALVREGRDCRMGGRCTQRATRYVKYDDGHTLRTCPRHHYAGPVIGTGGVVHQPVETGRL